MARLRRRPPSPAPVVDPVAVDDGDDDDEAKPQLSIPRVMVALLLAAALVGGTAMTVDRSLTKTTDTAVGATWFAPYVDTTLTPTVQFQDPGVNPARQVALGFIVADPHDGCAPSWGGYYTLDQAAESLNLDSRIALLRSQGGNVVVSFGGQANSELALSCTSTAQLTAAYRSVISRYSVTTVDFDIEGTALSDSASIERRAAAVASLQKADRGSGRHLAVWLTLPVATTGLPPEALSVISTTLAAGVDLAGVNVMAMDFGTQEPNMGNAVLSSLKAAHSQLESVYRHYGVGASSAGVWNRMGVTVMIGQNDTAGEIFTVADARGLVTFVKAERIRRVSMWSLNRDIQCGSSFALVGMHSNTCSGTTQAHLQFSKTFVDFTGSASAETSNQPTTLPTTSVVTDNPATSPYPIWQPDRPYIAGYKVVREGNVYLAKWYSQGEDPAAQVQSAAQTPWQLIGPVLPGDQAPTTTTLPPGTYPAWSPTATYVAGNRVLYAGLPYLAKWYNKEASPGEEDADPAASPWQPSFTVPGEPADN
jgi:chitinase